MIFLDTNIVIAALNDKPRAIAQEVATRASSGVDIAISSIVLFELQYGIAKSQRQELNRSKLENFLRGPVSVFDFSAEEAAIAGELRYALQSKGTPIGSYDILIAAHAVRHDAILVTANVREFKRVPGLKIENWGKW